MKKNNINLCNLVFYFMNFKLLLSLLLFTNLHTTAQEVDTLANVNITASRTNQKNSTSGKDIIILTGHTFEKMPSISIDDILKFSGGIEVQQRGPAGSQADIIIRGGTFQQVLVLLDGMKINDPITGHFSGYIPITPAEIERIEIVKGPAAAIYGSEAVGGVINIISKTFYKYKKEHQQQTSIGTAFGEYEMHSAQVSTYVTREKINFSVGATSNNADGQLLRGNNRGYFHNHLISGSAAIPLSKKWMLQFRSSYDYRDFAAQNFYTTFISDTATEKVNTWWNQVRFAKAGRNNTDQLDITFKKTSDLYLFNPASAANNNLSILSQINYTHTHVITKNLTGIIGGGYERKEIISNDRGNHQNNNGAVFTSVLWHYNHLNVSPQLRLVLDEQYKFEYLPQINLAYNIQEFTLRAGAGKSIRAADFTELYNNYNKPLVKSGSIGNPQLVAEKSMNYEIGLDFNHKNILFTSSYFLRKQEQMIDFVNTNSDNIKTSNNLLPNKVYAYAQNVKWVNTSGFECSLKFNKEISKDHHLTFIESIQMIQSSSSDSIASYYILSHATFISQQLVMWDYKKMTLCVESIFKERNTDKNTALLTFKTRSYWLVNAKLQFHFNKINMYFNVNNIGNINYCDLLGSKMPNSWSSVGINVKF